jgi:protein-tyrosine phosphatase
MTVPSSLSWIGSERLAIGPVPTPDTLAVLAGEGISHVVNCRALAQTWLTRDLACERALFGRANVAHAPMWDFGQSQHPRRWSGAVHFAVRALESDTDARVLIHCQKGRRRSVLVAYAVLRLRGHLAREASELIVGHRLEAVLVPVYLADVEHWIAAGCPERAGGPDVSSERPNERRIP